eukprot:GILJ01001782.1.p1 GENE.GILJ01001782.1~~GILJ01001782.1.p1  ORF type:complete len:368 (-),score=53.33 GILJ01001782.1:285-1235(-)
MTEHPPAWTYLFCAFGHFAYQTLDAIDGKQARRTSSSSPLGQLFDHGCDSLGSLFIALPIANCLQLGNSFLTLFFLYSIQIPFFLAQWEEYHTHIIRTHIGNFGVTEGQWTVIIVLVASGILPPGTLNTPLASLLPESLGAALIARDWNVPFYMPLMMLSNIATFGVALLNIVQVIRIAKHKMEAFLQLVPLSAMVALAFVWQRTSAFAAHALIGLITLGLLFTYLTSQIIVCGMCHMPYSAFQPVLLPLPFIVANSFASTLFQTKGPLVDEGFVMVAYGVFVGAVYSCFVVGTIQQITSYLQINCFTLKKQAKKQ